jgi:hypothetical protein
MTRKDFALIASVLLSERPDRDGTRWADGARDEWSTIVLKMADALGLVNAAFDRSRFLAACGME